METQAKSFVQKALDIFSPKISFLKPQDRITPTPSTTGIKIFNHFFANWDLSWWVASSCQEDLRRTDIIFLSAFFLLHEHIVWQRVESEHSSVQCR